jgi:hypothetical protein
LVWQIVAPHLQMSSPMLNRLKKPRWTPVVYKQDTREILSAYLTKDYYWFCNYFSQVYIHSKISKHDYEEFVLTIDLKLWCAYPDALAPRLRRSSLRDVQDLLFHGLLSSEMYCSAATAVCCMIPRLSRSTVQLRVASCPWWFHSHSIKLLLNDQW